MKAARHDRQPASVACVDAASAIGAVAGSAQDVDRGAIMTALAGGDAPAPKSEAMVSAAGHNASE